MLSGLSTDVTLFLEEVKLLCKVSDFLTLLDVSTRKILVSLK